MLAEEVAKTQEDLDGHILAQDVDVLASLFVRWNGDVLSLHSLADNPPLLEVNVNRVVPAILEIHQFPDFRAALAYPRTDECRIEEPAIHRPHTILAFEHPAPHRRRGNLLRVERAQRTQHRWHPANVLFGRESVDDDLQHTHARLPDILGLPRIFGAVCQTVHQVKLRTHHIAGKVDDDIRALGDPETDLGLVQQRGRQQVAVIADVSELLLHIRW
ncbi:hypothetical protein D3C81_1635900 [compost metagenome]